MTCIAGLERGGRVYLAGDSAAMYGDDCCVVTREPKVRRAGRVVLGVAGGARACDLVLGMRVPQPRRGEAPANWARRRFAAAVRAMLADAGLLDAPAEVLLGTGGVLLSLDGEQAVHSWAAGYGAAGVGAPYALGSLHCSGACQEPRSRLVAALEAAAAWCPAVAPPWHFVAV